MCALEVHGVDELFEAMNAAFALEAADGVVQFGVNEPEERGHRCSVAQVRLVLDDDRTAVLVANDDRETTPKGSSNEQFNECVGRRGTRRERSMPELKGAHEARHEAHVDDVLHVR